MGRTHNRGVSKSPDQVVASATGMKTLTARQSIDLLIHTRTSTAEDLGFIYSTWLKGFYFGNTWRHRVEQEPYAAQQRPLIEYILFHPETEIRVACLKEDPDVIVGYNVSRGTILDWIWVKPIWRKLGVGTMLMHGNTKAYTHLTTIGRAILRNKKKKWTFCPFKKG